MELAHADRLYRDLPGAVGVARALQLELTILERSTMRTIIALSVLLAAVNLAAASQQQSSGSLVMIGGALDPGNEEIYRGFIELGGGPRDIHIAVIPAASSTPSRTARAYMKDFIRYGVSKRQICIFPLALVDDPNTVDIDESTWARNSWDEKIVKSLDKVTAVFFVGGDQMRYWITMKDKEGNDSPLLQRIRHIYQTGGVIGGTSAGAAIMSNPMLIGGSSITALGPSQKNPVPLKSGMGFFRHGLVDQHFIKRGRLGRLIAALFSLDNHKIGFGIDEDTALVQKGNTLEVIGSSGVFLVDISKAEHRVTKRGLSATGIRLHYLASGDTYDLKHKTFTINPVRPPIKAGNEYYKETILDTNIFSKDAAYALVTQGLADNTATEAAGLAFTLEHNSRGNGSKLIFRQDSHTKGYWGKVNGKETYTALGISLQIVPLTISITEH
jgi:cyanophycinase